MTLDEQISQDYRLIAEYLAAYDTVKDGSVSGDEMWNAVYTVSRMHDDYVDASRRIMHWLEFGSYTRED